MLRVLQSPDENAKARAELDRRGLSLARSDWLAQLGRRLGIDRYSIGDARKSWDVLMTAQLIEQRLPKDAAIVDFGAFHSEITGILCRMGFTSLTGIDLNPKLKSGPYPDKIRYAIRDFLDTGFPDASFDCITSISAIEHGHSVDALLKEVSRLLKPGGLLVGSTDYWPKKIDTTGVMIFGMDWTIFSAEEMAAFFEKARAAGLQPTGTLEYDATTPSIDFSGRRYSFAWFALEKRPA